jgi:ATP-dependent Clp protease ATP-binding subunit ClpC
MTRFTDRAKAAVAAAQDAARALDQGYIGTEHLLLGLFASTESIAAKVLAEAGIDRERVEAAVVDLIGRGDAPVSGHLPFTPRAKQCLELSLREALELGHNYIGTEHILLGILREGDGVGAQILTAAGMAHDTARMAVIKQLTTT